MNTKQAKADAMELNYRPTAKEDSAVQKVIARIKTASPTARVKVRHTKITIDHPNRIVGNLLTMGALGTIDSDFMNGVLCQLANANSPGDEQSGLNFSISVVKGIEPRDQVEAMLAAQMAVTHTAAMRFARRLALAENLLELESAERSLNKLVRTFTTLTDALKRHRTVSEQSVTVQNVSVKNGSQAIVGNVTQHSGVTAPDQSPTSLPVITGAHTVPMPIIGEQEHDRIHPRLKSRS
jgi:hypothetical protein